MQRARARWSSEGLVSTAVVLFGTLTAAAALVHSLTGLMLLMFVSGGAWITFVSTVSALSQTLAPDWVRARMQAMFMLVTQGGLAAGSAFWGAIGSRIGVDAALLWAGLATASMTGLALVIRLPEPLADVTPWNHWRMPAIVADVAPELDEGPVLVTIEYRVGPDRVRPFLEAVYRFAPVRRRDGASRWAIYQDLEHPESFVEAFVVASWAEHLRQHERLTKADREAAQAVRDHIDGEPGTRHLIYVEPKV